MGAREERLGANEALFREVNEHVAEVAEQFIAGESPMEFSCECGDGACVEKIAMTVDEYEAVRAKATQFAVVPGHEVPDIERVVERQLYVLRAPEHERRPVEPLELGARVVVAQRAPGAPRIRVQHLPREESLDRRLAQPGRVCD